MTIQTIRPVYFALGFVSITVLYSAFADDTAVPSATRTVDKTIADLTDRITKLEQRVSKLEVKESKPAASTEPKKADTKAEKQAGNPLELVDWKHSFQRGQFQNAYRISVTLKNSANKKIKLIEAAVQFTDLLDAEIYAIRLKQDLQIDAGATVVNTDDYPINQFIPAHARLKDLDKEDVKAVFIVGRIVFTDNTILDLTKQ